MVNYYIYAKDFSGSTDGVLHFHTNGLKTVEQFKSDVDKVGKEVLNTGESPTETKIIYLHWGSKCYEVDEDTIRTTYLDRKSGNMGTDPKTIVNWLQENYDIFNENNKIKLLYIITDGLISRWSTEECFELNKNKYYETVVFHAFNENQNSIDLSVASSFFKNQCTVYCNYELYDCINISEEFDYDRINVDNFTCERDNLKSYIKLKFLKTAKDARSLQEIDKLKKLRDRLFAELSSRTLEKCKPNLETKDRSVFLREFVCTDWYKNLTGSDYDKKVDIEKSISTLINYIVNEVKSYSFDALKFDTKYNKSVEEEPVIDINFTAEQEIEFPDIILDDEKGIPVVILTTFSLLDKIIFHKTGQSSEELPASFNKFKTAMECPLFLLKDKDISESIGYFYTLNVYKQFLANNTNTEPRTRKPFHGGLVLTDTDQFDKYNDYILLSTYFDSKKVYFNAGLFYYVLWKNCEKKEWMDRNVVEQFKRYALRRISKTVCKIGLSSLPLDPQEHTSLPTALWYCVELSSSIFKNDPENFMHERLRMFYSVAQCMIEILKYFSYDLDLKTIEKRRDLISHVMILKKIQGQREKVYYLLERIFKTEDGFLVSEIEKPLNVYKLNYLKLNHKEILRDDVVEETVNLNKYVHLMYCVDLEGTIEICEKTCRPFFAIDQSKSFYTELVKYTRKAIIKNGDDKDKVKITYETIDSLEFDKLVSLYKLFIDCVISLEKYPTLPEYVEFISKRKRFHDDLVTIFPTNIYHSIKKVYTSYQKVVSKVECENFRKVCQSTSNRMERIKGEGRLKFNNEDDIKIFISSEELKVNLKKTM